MGVFDPLRIMDFTLSRAARETSSLKSALSKVFGIYDADDELIHIDDSVSPSKQGFLKPIKSLTATTIVMQ